MGIKKISLKILGMECAACAAKIERQLKKMDGVTDVAVNLAVEKVTVNYDSDRVSVDEMVKTIVDLGYRVPTEWVDLKISGMTRFDEDQEKLERERETRRQVNLLIMSAVLSIPLLAVMFADFTGGLIRL